jgi:integrase
MAWIEQRGTDTDPSYRVVWRQNGVGKQQQTFHDEDEAARLRDAVNRAGQRCPRGYAMGKGWLDEINSDLLTFRVFAEKTIRARAKADDRTKDDYLALARRWIFPVIGDSPLDEIDRFHVAEVANRAVAAKKSPKTIGNIHGLLSSILSDAVADELVRRNVAQGAMPNLPAVKSEDMVFLSHADFALLASCIPEGTERDIARLLVGTGLRWSELTALQVGDVDLLDSKAALQVRRAWKLRDGRYELGEPKTKRSRRTVSLSGELVSLLTPYAAQLDDAAFLFTSPQGRPVRHSNYYHRTWLPALFAVQNCAAHRQAAAEAHRAYKLEVRSAKRAGRPVRIAEPKPCGCPGTLTRTPRIHDLRHTHASWLLDAKITLPAIQRRLGHESIQTTIDRYSHLAPEHVDEINASIDRALAPR